MIVSQLGEGEPEIAIVGGIHGDEPCGVHAVETLLEENPSVERPVKCIIANERAIDRGERYVEADLNRVFPGDPESETHEERLAAALLDELAGCRTIGLHSTQSTPKPFAIGPELDSFARSVSPQLSIEAVVEAGACVDTALGSFVPALEVECGLQGSAQACANAERLVREFLGAMGALPAPTGQPGSVPVYRLEESIPKPPAETHAVHVPNFERVDEGQPYATSDDMTLVAEEPFYPVLMSPDGYERQFGYTAELTDRLEPAREALAVTEGVR